MPMLSRLTVSLAVLLAACATQTDGRLVEGTSAADPAPVPASSPPNDPVASEAPPKPCTDGITETCSAWNERAYCVVTAAGKEWRKEACADGCFSGKCSATACADECALGETKAGGRCQLWDMKTKAFVEAAPVTSMHDRARDYDRRLRTTSLANGQVVNVSHEDATLTKVTHRSGYRDAAIWTGSALAAQAWRLAATRSPDAERQVQAFVKALHEDFEVTGAPGYPARFVLPAGDPIALQPPKACGENDWKCGPSRDWVGGTSRDQYTGLMLGYLTAYLATTDEATKAIIRKDVVTVARELMKKRTNVPLRIVVDKVVIDKNVDLENVILVPAEMVDGRILADLATDDPATSGMTGMREFFPDFSVLVKQVLGIGQKIPRSGSAMMLGAFFEMAILMSGDDPAMKQEHQELDAYYALNSSKWLDVAEQWTFSTRDGCGKGYFSTHIAYIMAWAWASLATGPAIAPRIRDVVLDQKMWSAVSHHKNSYFAFMWGSTRPSALLDQAKIDSAIAQLAQFEPGPRVRLPRDTRASAQYLPHETSCAEALCDMETNAVDVKDRRVDDFIWQRQPWQLYEPGELTRVFPGADYLAAYWIARRYDLMTDDRAGMCARF